MFVAKKYLLLSERKKKQSLFGKVYFRGGPWNYSLIILIFSSPQNSWDGITKTRSFSGNEPCLARARTHSRTFFLCCGPRKKNFWQTRRARHATGKMRKTKNFGEEKKEKTAPCLQSRQKLWLSALSSLQRCNYVWGRNAAAAAGPDAKGAHIFPRRSRK